jgi:hypothetical protein
MRGRTGKLEQLNVSKRRRASGAHGGERREEWVDEADLDREHQEQHAAEHDRPGEQGAARKRGLSRRLVPAAPSVGSRRRMTAPGYGPSSRPGASTTAVRRSPAVRAAYVRFRAVSAASLSAGDMTARRLKGST